MACPCGSHTLKHRNSVYTDAGTRYELTYRECDRCGRQGYERLIQNTTPICEGPTARQRYALIQEGPIGPWLDKVPQSIYRPYKLWRSPDGRAIHVCLIKLDGESAAICPEFKLLITAEDYLEASLSLAGKLLDVLGLPPQSRFTATDSLPFELTWGSAPVFSLKRPARPATRNPISTPPVPEPAPTVSDSTVSLGQAPVQSVEVPAPPIQPAASEDTPEPGQLDLFG
ncbi:hypothetical protein [Marinobacter sp. MBR-105]|jgi:hypothetical protein